MSTTELTGRENLTKNTFCVGPVGYTDKENQVKINKSTVLQYRPKNLRGSENIYRNFK
jgi:hypothetical protein